MMNSFGDIFAVKRRDDCQLLPIFYFIFFKSSNTIVLDRRQNSHIKCENYILIKKIDYMLILINE